MKKFAANAQKAINIISHPLFRGVTSTMTRVQSLILIAIARVLKSENKITHSKCSKRRNVFRPHDLLVIKLNRLNIEPAAANNSSPSSCPFLGPNGCKLISGSLTVPSLCARRIIKENPELKQLENKLSRAETFLQQTVKLFGGRK